LILSFKIDRNAKFLPVGVKIVVASSYYAGTGGY